VKGRDSSFRRASCRPGLVLNVFYITDGQMDTRRGFVESVMDLKAACLAAAGCELRVHLRTVNSYADDWLDIGNVLAGAGGDAYELLYKTRSEVLHSFVSHTTSHHRFVHFAKRQPAAGCVAYGEQDVRLETFLESFVPDVLPAVLASLDFADERVLYEELQRLAEALRGVVAARPDLALAPLVNGVAWCFEATPVGWFQASRLLGAQLDGGAATILAQLKAANRELYAQAAEMIQADFVGATGLDTGYTLPYEGVIYLADASGVVAPAGGRSNAGFRMRGAVLPVMPGHTRGLAGMHPLQLQCSRQGVRAVTAEQLGLEVTSDTALFVNLVLCLLVRLSSASASADAELATAAACYRSSGLVLLQKKRTNDALGRTELEWLVGGHGPSTGVVASMTSHVYLAGMLTNACAALGLPRALLAELGVWELWWAVVLSLDHSPLTAAQRPLVQQHSRARRADDGVLAQLAASGCFPRYACTRVRCLEALDFPADGEDIITTEPVTRLTGGYVIRPHGLCRVLTVYAQPHPQQHGCFTCRTRLYDLNSQSPAAAYVRVEPLSEAEARAVEEAADLPAPRGLEPARLCLEELLFEDSLSPVRGQTVVDLYAHYRDPSGRSLDPDALLERLWGLTGGALSGRLEGLLRLFRDHPNLGLGGSQLSKLLSGDRRMTDIDLFVTGDDDEALRALNAVLATLLTSGRKVLVRRCERFPVYSIYVEGCPAYLQVTRWEAASGFPKLLNSSDCPCGQGVLAGGRVACSVDYIRYLQTGRVEWWHLRDRRAVERAQRYIRRGERFSQALLAEVHAAEASMPQREHAVEAVEASSRDFSRSDRFEHFACPSRKDDNAVWLVGLSRDTISDLYGGATEEPQSRYAAGAAARRRGEADMSDADEGFLLLVAASESPKTPQCARGSGRRDM
jgi:hypothetical protein